MNGVMRRLPFLVCAVLLLSAGSGAARSESATVGVYKSGTTFSASAAAPAGAGSSVSLAMPIGGVDDATLLVRGAQRVSLSAPTLGAPLRLSFFFAHYVSVDGKAVPDALMPWDGSQRATEHANQPLWLQVTVPYGTAPGTYHGSVVVGADGTRSVVSIAVTVAPVTIPRENQAAGSLLTAFNFSPQSYANKAAGLYGVSPDSTLPGLFSFLASYRLSPNSWGYGNPKVASGYTSDRRWWLAKTSQMVAAAGQPGQFASMWIPISNNRWSPSTYVGGRSPYKPQGWCSYLRSVHEFWQRHGWVGAYPYLYGMDEPGATQFRTVAKQAKVTHSCFPGSHVLVTGKPTARNHFLWNGGKDDVDAWVVLAEPLLRRVHEPVPVAARHHPRHPGVAADQRRAASPQADLDLHVRRRLPLDPRLHGHRARLRPAGLRRLGGVRGHQRTAVRAGDDHLLEGQPARLERQGQGLVRPHLPGQERPDRERPARNAARGDRGLGDPERRPAQAWRRGGAEAPLRPLLDHCEGRQARLHHRLPDQDFDAVLVADVLAQRGHVAHSRADARRGAACRVLAGRRSHACGLAPAESGRTAGMK